jgi:Spy/CpxP family protein refolding chaperone
MKKLLVVSLAAAALTGSVFAIGAAAAPDNPPPPAAGDMGGFMLDAHLAGMKAALKLTPEQEKNWAPFEAAVREAAKARADEMRAMREEMRDERPNPIARMTMMSERLAKAATQMKAVADAAKPLFDSLDETQKRHFGPLLMSLRERGAHGGAMMGGPMMGGPMMMEHGPSRGPDDEQ